MLVGTLIAALGFLATATGTRRYNLRLGGTIVLGVLAVYTLKNFSTLPIFIGSTAIAYGALWLAKRRTLIYGRQEFVVAILAGSVLPASIYVVAIYLPGPVQVEIARSVFIGSLLSGIAAFNFHRIRPAYRIKDIAGTAGVLLGLLALGFVLVGPQTRFLADYTPLVLFSATSDIAILRGAVVAGPVDPALIGRPLMIGVFALTLGLSESVRRVYAVHIGAVAMGLLAIYTVTTWRLPVLFVLTTVITFAVVTAIHRSSVLYGRALLSTAGALGAVIAVPLAVGLGVTSGISIFFTAVIAGIYAYYVHRVTERERYVQLAMAVGVFTALLLVVRAIIEPTPEGVPQGFGLLEVAVGLVVVIGALAVASYLTVAQPSDDAIRSASVFTSGGD